MCGKIQGKQSRRQYLRVGLPDAGEERTANTGSNRYVKAAVKEQRMHLGTCPCLVFFRCDKIHDQK